MAVTVVVGSQWGDEGKGKIVDYLSQKADYVVRFHGGPNAGHTVINQFGTFRMHLIPSGVFNPKTKGVIANGVVVDPEILLSEIDTVQKAGINLKGKLFVSPRSHLIMPYHRTLDKLFDDVKKGKKTATTGRGIGPVHADKVSYYGIRIVDLYNWPVFLEKLKVNVLVKNKILRAFGAPTFSFPKVAEDFKVFAQKLKPFVKETYYVLNQAVDDGKNLLFEGAHGIFLDNDWGTYPFVTASSILSGQIMAGSGVSPQKINQVIGIAKAYMTRVDNGECPVPTEIKGKLAEFIREKGHEYGATTGRPRRIAWFDTNLVGFSSTLNGMTGLALTRLDTLSGVPKIKVCVAYQKNGHKVNYLDGDAEFLRHVKPIYQEFSGWNEDISHCKTFKELPVNVRKYVEAIEKLTKTHVRYLSVGAEREKIIERL